MKLLLPLGLLGLLSIIALIIIYIIKPKFYDKTVSSTFVWKLSLKYRKPKMPLQWLKQSLLFILQVLVLVSLTLMLARPFVELKSVSGEKVLILDASAGMQAEKNGKTRFDRAVSEILDIAEKETEENRVTVILAGRQASYVVRRTESYDQLFQAMKNVACTFGEADLKGAVQLAERVLDENPGAEVILFSDRDYEQPGYVTVRDVSDGEWNAAVLNLDAELKSGYYEFAADVGSYGKDAELTVTLNVDEQYEYVKTVRCPDGEPVRVTWWNENDDGIYEYDTVSVTVAADDSLPCDNTLTLCGDIRPRYVELVSEYPTLLNMALLVSGHNSVYQAALKPSPVIYGKGYDLYVYEGLAPSALPKDGSVLLINPKTSVFGLKLGSRTEGKYTALPVGGLGSNYRRMMEGMSASGIGVTAYTKLVSYDNSYEVLMTCGKDPVVLTKTVDGIRVVAVLFDLHYSELPLLPDFPLFVYNTCEYAAPHTLPSRLYTVGDEVGVSVKPNAVHLNVSQDGDTASARYDRDVTASDVIESVPVTADAPGLFTVTQTLSGGTVRTDSFFVRIPAPESDFSARGGVLAAETYQRAPDAGDWPDAPKHDTFDFYPYIAGLLLLLLVVEWGVQYREQF